MSGDVELHISISRAEYRFVSAVANRREINAHTLIEQMVTHAVEQSKPVSAKGRRKKPIDTAKFRLMHAQGASDADMAAAFKVDRKTIRTRRDSLGLPANLLPGGAINNTPKGSNYS